MERQVQLVISLFFIFFFSSCSKKSGNDSVKLYCLDSIQLENRNGFAFSNGKLFTGRVYSFYPQSKDTLEVMGFKNGRENGEWKVFYKNRQISSQRFYSNGIKVKALNEWWENGKPKRKTNFVKGETNGIYMEWDSIGRVMKSMNYTMGYEDGLQKTYYANGKLKSNYTIIKGRRYGLLGTKNCVNVKDSIY